MQTLITIRIKNVIRIILFNELLWSISNHDSQSLASRYAVVKITNLRLCGRDSWS